MLLFTAVISLILGMGLPTTANYIVVITLMAPVIRLGAGTVLLFHWLRCTLFVFYFSVFLRMIRLGRSCGLKRSGNCEIRSDSYWYPRLHLRYPYRYSTFHVHLQYSTTTDGHWFLRQLSTDYLLICDCGTYLRSCNTRLVVHEEQVVGNGAAYCINLHFLPPWLLVGHDLLQRKFFRLELRLLKSRKSWMWDNHLN